MKFDFPFAYCGDPELGECIAGALRRVVDPEMAIGIVDLGLVYGVEARSDEVRVRITMTSAACPVTELIVEDIVAEVGAALGEEAIIRVDVCWDPPWGPERMSARARRVLDAP
ncbi:MAG TPA: metal-sulfur cluster assembly factor [Usitatibacter sp.]|jgi:metal-sulfur cluster biosynthetic enzyme|nr:metal-sulfur cluster assembly factor [Usitatibacter sp.]